MPCIIKLQIKVAKTQVCLIIIILPKYKVIPNEVLNLFKCAFIYLDVIVDDD